MIKSYSIQQGIPSFSDVFLPIESTENKILTTKTVYSTFNSDRFHKLIISLINNAKHTILLSSFLIANEPLENALIDASERGVRVYILTSTDVYLKKLENKDELSDFDKETINHHISLLNKFSKSMLCRSAEHLHAKFIMIDPVVNGKFNGKSKAFVSTANFTTKALTINPELVVEVLREKDKMELYKLFIKGFWIEAQQELKMNGKWEGVRPKDLEIDVNLPHTSENNNSLLQEIISRISKAQNIVLGAFSLQKDHVTIQNLLKKHIPIELFTRPRDMNADTAKELMKKKGVYIYLHNDIHAKFLLTVENGRKRALVFTANLSSLGLDQGYEVGIDLVDPQIKELEKIIDNWKGQMQYVFQGEIQTGRLQNFSSIYRLKNHFVKYDIVKSKPELKIVKPKTIRKLKDAYDWLNFTPNFIDDRKIFLEITKELTIDLPSLPKKLQKQMEKGMPKRQEKINGKKIEVFSPNKGSDFIIVQNVDFLANAGKQYHNLQIYRRD